VGPKTKLGAGQMQNWSEAYLTLKEAQAIPEDKASSGSFVTLK
jgi:hypothetical protein